MELAQPQSTINLPPGIMPGRGQRPWREDPPIPSRPRPGNAGEIELVRDVANELRVRESVAQLTGPQLEFRPRERDERLNRAVNFVLAIIGIVLTAPVMLIVAALVKLTSPGPILYTQERVGLDRRRGRVPADGDRRARNMGGQLFTIYKFRSMRVDAETNGAVWATKNDPRVTSIGKVLRKLRLDELPQLFNVLKGDMNIVGPRPERPCIFGQLREEIQEYPLRQLAKPGITGWAQVNHTYDTSVEDVKVKVRYDLEYLQRQSVWTDMVIMAKTVPVMLFRKSGW
jgi:lipopolysaccharide/colanic/teichoic acid biosynthesis glycosyltransferase